MKEKGWKERAKWLQFRDKWIANKDLVCHYCGRKDLLDDAPDNPRTLKCHIFRRKNGMKQEDVATIDHVIPISIGGERYDETNLVVCCCWCNSQKGSLIFSEWLIRIKKDIDAYDEKKSSIDQMKRILEKATIS